MDMALMETDVDNLQSMASRLATMKNKLDIVQQFFREVMVSDVDYGIIPGTPKPTLYKSGAEKLCELYGFAIEIADKREERDFKTGFYLAEVTVRLRHRATGQVVAEGVGEANVYEAKYRWRWVGERDLPRGIDKENLLSKEFSNRDGGKWSKYRLENADLFDQWNTVLKMAKKRSLVDATLSATRSSGIFSQSEDDFEAYIMAEGEADKPVPSPKATKAKPSPSGITINFGKYKGQTLEDIHEEDPSYLEWLVKNAKEEKVRVAANKLLTGDAKPEPARAPETSPKPSAPKNQEDGPTQEDLAIWEALQMGDDD